MSAVEAVACVKRERSVWSWCRCASCRPAQRRLRKLHSVGLLPASPSDRAWDVIDGLLERDWSACAIASAAGLPDRSIESALADARTGHRRVFGRALAAAIINHAEVPTRGHVSALGATRRLQALTAIGWSLAALAAESGIPTITLSVIRSGRIATTHAPTAAAVAAVYEALSMHPRTSTQTRRYAAAQGWVPPLAWDEGDLDNPAATPAPITEPTGVDEIRVIRALAGDATNLTPDERHQVVAHLDARGLSAKAIATLTGVTTRTVVRDRRALANAAPASA